MKITKEKLMSEIRAYLLITFGLLIYTFSVTAFLAPHRMVGGGVTGISTIIYFLSGEVIPIGYSYFVINFLLVTIAIKILGPRFGFKTIYAIFMSSFLLSVLQNFIHEPLLEDKFMCAVISGIMCGAGIGISLVNGGSTAGTDIIAMILKKYTKLNIGGALFLVDLFIVLASCLVFDAQTGLFSLCGLLAKSLVVDNVIESINMCKYFTIICNDPEPICEFITQKLNRSATVYHAEGAYQHNDKAVILSVMKRSQAVELRNFIHENQPSAFIAITNSSEIIGKGFRGLN